MNKSIVTLLILFAGIIQASARDTLILSLNDVIRIAKEQSPSSRMAQTSFNNRHWQYRSFRANYKPQLRLNAVLPELDRSIAPITQDNGRDVFIRRSLATSFADLGISQNIGHTGSQVFLSSQLRRIDVFTDPRTTSYMTTPALIGIRQPVLGFNPLLWDMRIEPLKYEEARKQLNEDMETVSLQAVELFFRLLQAQNTVKIHQLNVLNNDTLFQISTGRYNLGKIAENDLLQMELNLMKARNDFSQAEMDREIAMTRLLNFLKLPPNTPVLLVEPVNTPDIIISEDFALEQARMNRADIVEYNRMMLEAERFVSQAKAESRFSADIFASYGLTQSAPDFENAYVNPLDQQRLRIALEVPILTWGKNKAQLQTAIANKELTAVNTEQARENFEQEIILLVRQLSRYREKLEIASRADTIAQRRFDITMSRYLIGKIGILDLNLALQEKDQAKASYLLALEQYWNIFFDIRRKTLYDFLLNAPINY